MEIPKIENLDQLLRNYLGQDEIIDCETARLTLTGENYGSQMLALKIRTKNDTVLDVVGKVPPPGEFMQKMFNIPVTFRNELEFYSTIKPELEKFLREKNLEGYLDSFPEFLGGRLSTDPTKNEVDDGAAIILDNLKVQDYVMLDRTVGFDLPTAKILIEALAKYHVVPLGFKLQKPDIFNTKMRSLFKEYKVFDLDDTILEGVIEKIRKIVQETKSAKYEGRVVKALKNTTQFPKNSPELIREPLVTLIHTDAWVNNFMVQYQNKVPKKCKIVDFQLGEYGSPLRDLVFFIFSSVQIPVIQQHYDDLIKLYHGTFLDGLQKLGCDSSNFSLSVFEQEMSFVVKQFEFFHCMIMLEPIFASKESLKELNEYTEDDMSMVRPVTQKHKERAAFIVSEFARRNWI